MQYTILYFTCQVLFSIFYIYFTFILYIDILTFIFNNYIASMHTSSAKSTTSVVDSGAIEQGHGRAHASASGRRAAEIVKVYTDTASAGHRTHRASTHGTCRARSARTPTPGLDTGTMHAGRTHRAPPLPITPHALVPARRTPHRKKHAFATDHATHRGPMRPAPRASV